MLRGPFVRLFEPLLVSHSTTKQSSLRLSKRGGRRLHTKSTFADSTVLSHAKTEHDHESEIGIVKDGSLLDERRRGRSRRGSQSGIFVVKEVSVVCGDALQKGGHEALPAPPLPAAHGSAKSIKGTKADEEREPRARIE